MYKKTFLILLFSSLMFSCKNERSDKEIPTLSQSIDFITHKIDGKEISLRNGVVGGVEFEIKNGICNYRYEYISAADNTHYEIVETFPLKDIEYISFNSSGLNHYITVNLDKYSNRRFSRSLNYRSLSDYGLQPQETLRESFINVRESDRDAVLKAFRNIVKIQEDNMATEYFEKDNS